MSVAALIKFAQGASTPAAGLALIGTVGVLVTASNGDNANVQSWEWEWFSVPTASAIATGIIASGSVPTISFTPDVAGTYVLVERVYDRLGNLSTDMRCFSVLEVSGRLIPNLGANQAAMNFGGQTKGWHPYIEAWLKAVDTDIARPFVDVAEVGKVIAGTWPAGSFTAGTRFRTHIAFSCTGLKLWVKYTGSKTLKCSIYTSASGTPLKTVDVAVTGTGGVIANVAFSTALALPATPVTDDYYAVVWEKSAAVYPALSAANAAVFFGTTPFFMQHGVYYVGCGRVAGDAKPTTNYAPATTEFYPVLPILVAA